MNTAQAVKIFLTRFVRTGKFPFEIEVISSYQPNETTMQAFKETEKMIETDDFGAGYPTAHDLFK